VRRRAHGVEYPRRYARRGNGVQHPRKSELHDEALVIDRPDDASEGIEAREAERISGQPPDVEAIVDESVHRGSAEQKRKCHDPISPVRGDSSRQMTRRPACGGVQAGRGGPRRCGGWLGAILKPDRSRAFDALSFPLPRALHTRGFSRVSHPIATNRAVADPRSGAWLKLGSDDPPHES